MLNCLGHESFCDDAAKILGVYSLFHAGKTDSIMADMKVKKEICLVTGALIGAAVGLQMAEWLVPFTGRDPINESFVLNSGIVLGMLLGVVVGSFVAYFLWERKHHD